MIFVEMNLRKDLKVQVLKRIRLCITQRSKILKLLHFIEAHTHKGTQMNLQDYLDLLNEDELKLIKEADEEYVFFDISAPNVGVVARIEISNDILPDWDKSMNMNWNGYDAILLTEELQELI